MRCPNHPEEPLVNGRCYACEERKAIQFVEREEEGRCAS